MNKIAITPRPNWKSRVESLGFNFHSVGGTYWDESAYYTFTLPEIETIEKATENLWDLCLRATQHVIDQKLYHLFHIPDFIIPKIEQSWDNDDTPTIYGRFDFAWNPTTQIPKLLEFNADTPTSLFEAGVVQWDWLQSVSPERDQFNSIHEKLIEHWKAIALSLRKSSPLYFSTVTESEEDRITVEYLRDCAHQAGIDTQFIYLEDIGWDLANRVFVDGNDKPIHQCFKLYPWEWLIHEEFGPNIITDRNATLWIEPAWKMILSNKAILPILWKLFPECPYLLPTYFDNVELRDYAKKPLLSREGANITIVKDNHYLTSTEGEYGEEGYIYQALAPLPEFEGKHALIGSWIIGGEPAGIGIRESDTLITDNLSRFVPHLIV